VSRWMRLRPDALGRAERHEEKQEKRAAEKRAHQMGIATPWAVSHSLVSTISMASHGQPSRKAPSGPLLVHFLQPMQSIGSTSICPNGGCSSSGTQYMQSSTGQYGTQAGDPAQPVQHSVMTAISFGFFFRGVSMPSDLGCIFSSVGIGAMVAVAAMGPRLDY